MAEPEQDAANRATVDELLQIFSPVSQRLSPEIEPATVYLLKDLSPPADDEK